MVDQIPSRGTSVTQDPEQRRTLIELLTIVVRNRRLLIGMPLIAALSAFAFSFLLPERYTVESRFVPETGSAQGSRLAGLAAQFGFDVGGGEMGESVDFYAELLESHDLLRSVVLTDFSVPLESGDTIHGNLVELLDAKGEDPDIRTRNAVEQLADLVDVRPDPSAKLVTLRTSAPWPELAVAVNVRVLELLSEFNLERRQSRAAAEREFLEGRVREAGADLIAAESALEQFLSENRRMESPQLTFENARLQRRVDLLQQLYMSLSQGYEQARVDEVRNTPVITIIDHPRGPARKTSPNVPMNVLLGLVLGAFLAVTVVIVRETLANMRERSPEQFAELRAAAHSTAGAFTPSGFFRRDAGNGAAVREDDARASSAAQRVSPRD